MPTPQGHQQDSFWLPATVHAAADLHFAIQPESLQYRHRTHMMLAISTILHRLVHPYTHTSMSLSSQHSLLWPSPTTHHHCPNCRPVPAGQHNEQTSAPFAKQYLQHEMRLWYCTNSNTDPHQQAYKYHSAPASCPH